MDYSIEKYRARRDKRLGIKPETDAVREYRSRRSERLEERFDAGIGWVFGALKSKGVDTTGMSVSEAFETWNELNSGNGRKSGKEEPKGKPPKAPKVSGMSARDVSKTIGSCHKIGGANYDKATAVAKEKPVLRTFTTHGMDHVEQVLEKTNQAADVVERLNGPRFKGTKMDRKLMLVSAYFHDTGMDGGDIDWGDDDGSGIRGSHGINSALHVLRNAKDIEKIGVNPSQAAFVAFAHTKSKSGIGDLMDPNDWKSGLDNLEKAVDEYNKRNPGKEIKFDRDSVFGGEPTEDNISHMACQVAALRLGDANREANIPLRSQTGGEYNVDKLPDQDKCTSRDAEAELAKISIKNDTGTHDLDDDDDEELGVLPRWSRNISKYTVLGERNMTKVDAVYNDKFGTLQEDVTLANGNDVPWSTTEALLERCGELNTINGIPRAIRVKMTGLNSVDDMTPQAKKAYMDMWNRIENDIDKKTGKRKFGGLSAVIMEFEDGSTETFGGNNLERSGRNIRNGRNG